MMKDVQSSPQLETLRAALKVLEVAMDEIRVGVLAQRSWRV